MKKLLLLILSIVFVNTGFCQPLSSYNFSAFNSPYTSLTTPFMTTPSGGTLNSTSTYDDCWYNNIPIGFNFVYNCNTYNSLSASANCWVVLGQTLGTSASTLGFDTYDDDLSNTFPGGANLPRPILAPFWIDASTATPTVRYSTTGIAPNRIFTIEWDSVAFVITNLFAPFTGGPAVSVELKLYESTNVIDFTYNFLSTYTTFTGFLAIGITGGNGPVPVTGVQPYWSLNSTGTSPTPSMTTESRSLTGVPATGQVYRWDPNCTGIPNPGTVSATVTAACAPYTSVVSVPPCVPLGITFQWQSSLDGATGWTNVPGATNASYTASVTGTIYYRCVYLCTNSGLSAPSAPIQLILNIVPAPISGTMSSLCTNSTTTLTEVTTGGSWSSSNTGIATVTSSGVVTGVAVGIASISYIMPAGCYVTYPINIVTTPVPISGAAALLCQGLTIALTDGTAGGTWSSSNTGVATINTTGTPGIVHGLAPGTTTITYSLGSCFTSTVVTVNPAPAPIGGVLHVCAGLTTQLTDATPGGTWLSNPTIASTGSTTGIATGSAVIFTTTTTVTYTAPGGCSITALLTVNALPQPIGGTPVTCSGTSTTLTDPGGGIWTSSNTARATVGSSSGAVWGVSGGTATITYTLPSGCDTTTTVTIGALPGVITGVLSLCENGSFTTLFDTSVGGFWQSSDNNIASIDAVLGVVQSGIVAGLVTITYTNSSFCPITAVLTVNPSPPPIAGPGTVCTAATITLTDPITGGTWTSSNPAVASIGFTNGIVTGGTVTGSSGFTTITYTAPSGCSITTLITVYPPPNPISGVLHVCAGQSVILSDPPGLGTWMSVHPGIAMVTPGPTGGGVTTGVTPGTDTIIYTQPSTFCTRVAVVTVNAAPGPITGTLSVCAGSTVTLTDPPGTGTWASSTATVATAGLTTGIITGVLSGTAPSGITTITYSTGGTCVATAVVTVYALPAVFTVGGGGSYCAGGAGIAITLSGSVVGVHYQLSVGGTPVGGVVTGTGSALTLGTVTTAGTYTIVAANAATGCSRTMTGSAIVTAAVVPSSYAVTGGGNICPGVGALIGLAGSDIGVTYTLHNGAATITTTSGTGSSFNFGTYTVAGTYTVTATSGCPAAMPGSAVITILPLPAAFTVTGSGTVCPGGAGPHILLSNSAAGVGYQLFLGTSMVGASMPGTGASIDFGAQPAAGTYTVVATNTSTGCTKLMTGSATVTISAVPTIMGPTAVCAGASIPESAPGFTGGTWSSSNTLAATVVAGTGLVTGTISGSGLTTTITYTTTGGCTATTTVAVSSSPGPITGSGTVCVGAATIESDLPSGGSWTSSATSVATVVPVGSGAGTVTGVSGGTATITYSLGSGCTVTRMMTVTPAPSAILGSQGLCAGATSVLTDGIGGGSWASSNTVVTVISGTVTAGITPGTSVITYTLGGCSASVTVTVNSAPLPVSGASSVCAGATATLSDGISGGTWTSSNTTVATVDGNGHVSGLTGGLTTITYSLGGSCVVQKIVTVNPIQAIVGSTGMCLGTTTTLTDGTPGGTWSSVAPGVATVSGGTVLGLSQGTAAIFYTTAAGCSASVTVTVNLAPSIITGTTHVCMGVCTPLSDTISGGTWTSSNTSVATVGSSSGLVCGNIAGTSTITYSLGFGCTKSVVVTVNGLPGSISGGSHECAGSSTALSSTAGGGTWSSSNTAVATFLPATSGIITGAGPGTTTVTYTPPTGCSISELFTVTTAPAAIGGPVSICEGPCTLLSDATTGGTWTSSNTAVAVVNATSGQVCGISGGFATIQYSLGPGCMVSELISVLPPPPPILGSAMVCTGSSSVLSDAATGGTWSTGPSSLATINSTSGVLWGVSSGTVIVSYTIGTGCSVISSIIVNALSPIAGNAPLCQGMAMTLTDTTGSGSWSSSDAGIATAITSGVTTGLIGGVAAGTATVTYTLPTGCGTSVAVTVNAAPPAISGLLNICVGSTSSLSGGSAWSSSNTLVAVISGGGVVTGVSYGTATITTTSPGTGCPAVAVVTVNPVPPAIGGPSSVCLTGSATITLTDAVSGGTWSVSPAAIATIDPVTGVLTGTGTTGGAATAVYTLVSGCTASEHIGVNATPAAISGLSAVCVGSTITLTDAATGGTWSSTATGIATVDPVTGVVTGGSGGTVTISYSTAAGCGTGTTITVPPQPGAIMAPAVLCQGLPSVLGEVTTGGTWSSSDASVVSINAATGMALPVSAGCVGITYTTGSGCSVSATVCVSVSPDPITGTGYICINTSITLAETSVGGDWSSSNTGVATVDAAGNVYGFAVGTSAISYSSGVCAAVQVVTVSPMPGSITGVPVVCTGAVTVLGDSPGGGIWSSSDASVATVDSVTGAVLGVTPLGGFAGITYSLGAGCTQDITVAVNPAPGPVTGPSSPLGVCEGATVALFEVTTGGLWSSSNGGVAGINPFSGALSGLLAGTATISYSLPTGCSATAAVTVHPSPQAITGPSNVCLHADDLFTDVVTGGVWTSSNGGVATVGSSSGVVHGVAIGSVIISYSLGFGCSAGKIIQVQPLPTVFALTGGRQLLCRWRRRSHRLKWLHRRRQLPAVPRGYADGYVPWHGLGP